MLCCCRCSRRLPCSRETDGNPYLSFRVVKDFFQLPNDMFMANECSYRFDKIALQQFVGQKLFSALCGLARTDGDRHECLSYKSIFMVCPVVI